MSRQGIRSYFILNPLVKFSKKMDTSLLTIALPLKKKLIITMSLVHIHLIVPDPLT